MRNRNDARELEQREMRRRSLAALGLDRTDENQKYSFSRALLCLADGQRVPGFEGELNDELHRRAAQEGKDINPASLMVPTSILLTRDLSASTPSAGGYLVQSDNLGGSFIDLLRARMVLTGLGATFLSGLRGNVTIPKQTAGATAYWLPSDGSPITESEPTFGQVSMTPKTVGAYTEFTRQLLLQSNPAVDALIANDLAKVLALAIEAASISGSGSSGQPTGLLSTSGIGSVSGTSLSLAGVLEYMTDLAGSNAIQDESKLGYLTTPTVAALLCQRQRFTGTDTPLWEGNVLAGSMLGLPAMSTTAMPADTMILGDWSQMVIGEWGVLEIATNPAANFKAGIIGIRAMQSVDIAFRHAGAFSVASSIS